jgi:hypothetical protein
MEGKERKEEENNMGRQESELENEVETEDPIETPSLLYFVTQSKLSGHIYARGLQRAFTGHLTHSLSAPRRISRIEIFKNPAVTIEAAYTSYYQFRIRKPTDRRHLEGVLVHVNAATLFVDVELPRQIRCFMSRISQRYCPSGRRSCRLCVSLRAFHTPVM